MKRVLTVFATAMLFLALVVSSQAQTFQQCADVDNNGSVNVADLVRVLNSFQGGVPVPEGKGDVDFRQGLNLGDIRYLAGYIFLGYPEGGCPPFPAYPLLDSPDSLFLPEITVPVGSGSLIAPISVSNIEAVSELLITARLLPTNCIATIDSVRFINWTEAYPHRHINGAELTLSWFSVETEDPLPPGSHTIATVHVSYSASTGGTAAFVEDVFEQNAFTHQVYGPFSNVVYQDMKIGVPNISTRAAQSMPSMSVAPDSLTFIILHGSGDPASQTFAIQSDGAVVVWSSAQPSWIDVTPSTGLSGSSVTVQPLTAGLNPGTHTGTIVVSSPDAYNSPKNVKVVLRLLPQYPAFDANCDGMFNISDIVRLLVYIFGGPAPCDPCTGKKLE